MLNFVLQQYMEHNQHMAADILAARYSAAMCQLSTACLGQSNAQFYMNFNIVLSRRWLSVLKDDAPLRQQKMASKPYISRVTDSAAPGGFAVAVLPPPSCHIVR